MYETAPWVSPTNNQLHVRLTAVEKALKALVEDQYPQKTVVGGLKHSMTSITIPAVKSPEQVKIEELERKVGHITEEAGNWKVRALRAEEALAEMLDTASAARTVMGWDNA